LGEHIGGGIDPTEAQVQAYLDYQGEGRVHMINLLKYRPRAEYPQGHELAGEAGGTGGEAYQRYGAAAVPKIFEYGGRIVGMSRPYQVFIGEGQDWDDVVTVEYPNHNAFIEMMRDPEYRAAIVHRDAGLERTVVIAAAPLTGA
jgi:uncharacterized protein (DUF1330 family)